MSFKSVREHGVVQFSQHTVVQVVAEDVVVATKNGSSIGIAFVEFKHYQDAERMQVCSLQPCRQASVSSAFCLFTAA